MFVAVFCWEIIPTWIFRKLVPRPVVIGARLYPFWSSALLTAVSIICMIDNGRHVFVRNLFGAGSPNEGLGLFSFSFDWILVSQAYPLYWPLQTQVNSWIGLGICYVVMIAGFYRDLGDGKSRGLPFMSASLFTGNGCESF